MKYSLTPKTYPLDELCIKVHSRVLDSRHECKRLWYLLRALDEDGRGYGAVSISQACEYLGCTPATFYRMLNQGVGLWFRGYSRIGGGVVRIWYSAVERVCAALGIARVGAIAFTDSECLSRAGAKGTATALDAQFRQRQAHWQAEQNNSGKRVLKPWLEVSSENSAGAKYVFSKGNVVIPGISLKGIAKDAEYKEQTIKRRLDNSWRVGRDLSPIQKKRSAHKVAEGAHILDIPNSGFLIEDGKVYRVIPGTDSLYRLGPNLYAEDHHLLSCRFLRSKVGKAVRKVQISDPPCTLSGPLFVQPPEIPQQPETALHENSQQPEKQPSKGWQSL